MAKKTTTTKYPKGTPKQVFGVVRADIYGDDGDTFTLLYDSLEDLIGDNEGNESGEVIIYEPVRVGKLVVERSIV